VVLQPDGKILVGYYNASFVGTCTRLNPDGTHPRLQAPVWADNALRLTLRGLPGLCCLESSPDLHTWLPLATLTNLTDKAECADVPPIGQPTRIYRAVVKQVTSDA
jgi:hypothetical protein